MVRTLKLAVCSVTLLSGLDWATGSTKRYTRRTSTVENESNVFQFSDPKDCTDTELSSVLHTKKGVKETEFVKTWAYTNNYFRRNAQEALRSNDYLNSSQDELFVKMGGSQDVDYIFWGTQIYKHVVSAYTSTYMMTDTFNCGPDCYIWHFEDPYSNEARKIKQTTVLDDGAIYVPLASVFMHQYQHILIDYLVL